MSPSIIDEIKNNNIRLISKIITDIENGTLSEKIKADLYPNTINSVRIGITGPPGAGKSTITNQLINQCIMNKESVGVIAIDPTSPFSGGALLGDRVRMNKYHDTNKVFIRSMGNHGQLGGISTKAHDVADVLAASGKDLIIFETVGVGQAEHDIIRIADLVLVVLVPESGDEVQLMKAGLIEIGDIFAVNKSDRPGANKLASRLKNTLHLRGNENKVENFIYNLTANEGIGIPELFLGIKNQIRSFERKKLLLDRRKKRYKYQVKKMIAKHLEKNFWNNFTNEYLEKTLNSIDMKTFSPEKIAKMLIQKEFK